MSSIRPKQPRIRTEPSTTSNPDVVAASWPPGRVTILTMLLCLVGVVYFLGGFAVDVARSRATTATSLREWRDGR